MWRVAGQSLAMHSLATLQTVLLGFAASVAISVPLALAITSSRSVGDAIYPLLVLTQSVPKVALAPLLVVDARCERAAACGRDLLWLPSSHW